MSEKQVMHLVDDDEAIRHSAAFMLRHSGFVVRTYKDGETFLAEIPGEERGCILLDVRMPGMDGMQVLQALSLMGIDMPVIILTGHGDIDLAVAAMKAGAVDFVQKPYEKAALLTAVNRAFNRLADHESLLAREREATARLIALTAREREVLERLANGMTNKAIGESLQISARTVEIHRAHLMEKLGADSLSSALKIAFAAGIGFPD